MVRVDMQNGNNADCPPFPGIGCGKKIMVFRSMGVASSREGIGAGITCKGGGVDFLNFISPRYVMVIVLRGRGTFTDDRGQCYQLEAGSFFQRQPGIPHSNAVETGSGWVEVYLEVGPLFYQSLRAMRIIHTERPVQKLGDVPDLPQRIWRLIHDLQNATEERLTELAVTVLELLRSCQTGTGIVLPDQGRENVLELACHALGTNFTGTVNLHEFCARHGWGYEHFRKVFKARLGISPWQYRVRRKLDAASALLQDKQRTIAEIAERLGYSSAYEFSAQFKRYIGISPLFYREGRRN